MNLDQSFDAFGGNPAGGWSAANETSFSTQMPGQGAQQAKNEYEKYYLPVTVAQLMTIPAGEEKLSIGTYGFNHVRLIATIVEADENTGPQANYRIKDFNAGDDQSFPVMQYLSVQGTTRSQTYVEGTTVFLTGRIRTFDETNSILVYEVFPINDQAEIECHYKEVRFAELFFSKDIPNRLYELGDEFKDTMLSPFPPASRNQQQTAKSNNPFGQMQNAAPNQVRGINAAKYAHDSIQNDQQQRVFDFLSKINAEEGGNINVIRQGIGGDSNFDKDLEYLTNAGVIYSTMDDFHFAIVPM